METSPGTENKLLVPEKVLFTWKSPSRVFRKKTKDFWVKLISVSSLLGFIFFIAEGIMPVVLLASVLFLFYIMSTAEPENISYSITNKGINIADKKNDWNLFRSYQIVESADASYLLLNMNVIPGRIDIIVKEADKKKIKEFLSKYIPEDQSPKTHFDKASDWIADKMIR